MKFRASGRRAVALLLTAVSIAGCTGGSEAPATTVVMDFTPVTASTSTKPPSTTTAVVAATTKPGPQWPADAPFVDLYEDDEIKRTEQFNAYMAWQSQDSDREAAHFGLYVEPGSREDKEVRATIDLNKGIRTTAACPFTVDSMTRWDTPTASLVWMQSVGSIPACSGQRNGAPISGAAVPLFVEYLLWSQQSDGKWLVRELNYETEILQP
jgi:hypothetical protein